MGGAVCGLHSKKQAHVPVNNNVLVLCEYIESVRASSDVEIKKNMEYGSRALAVCDNIHKFFFPTFIFYFCHLLHSFPSLFYFPSPFFSNPFLSSIQTFFFHTDLPPIVSSVYSPFLSFFLSSSVPCFLSSFLSFSNPSMSIFFPLP